MASCTALWGTLSLPPLHTHAPINYLHDSLAYFLQVVMQISPDFCIETFHLYFLSQVFIIFLTLCTSYHSAYYLPCYCVFLKELNFWEDGDFHLSCSALCSSCLELPAARPSSRSRAWKSECVQKWSLGSQRAVLSEFWGEVWQQLYFWEYFDFQ